MFLIWAHFELSYKILVPMGFLHAFHQKTTAGMYFVDLDKVGEVVFSVETKGHACGTKREGDQDRVREGEREEKGGGAVGAESHPER